MQHFAGFWGENSCVVSRDQILDSVLGPSGHNSMDRKKSCKVFSPICNKKFPVIEINEHADSCLDRQTTPTIICIRREEDDENLEENYSRPVNRNSLSRTDIAAIISSAVNNECRVIKVDFVKTFNKKWNIEKRNHKYCILFVGELGIDTDGVSREFYSDISFFILFLVPRC